MDIKAIMVDFDGTALQRDQVFLSVRNMHALRRAMDKGIHVVPCTGRSADMFPPQIEADKRIRYWVSASGCRVLDRATGEIIYKTSFTPEETAAACRVFEGQGIYSEIAAEGKIYMEREVNDNLYRYPVPSHHVWYVEAHRQIPIEKPSEYFLAQGIGAEKINLYGVPQEKQQPFVEIYKNMPAVSFMDGPPVNLQFTTARLDKVAAVQALLDRLGIGYENVMSLGDSPGMDGIIIERAGLGIAMGNAPDELKEKAYAVTAPFYEDGLAQAIEKYLLD